MSVLKPGPLFRVAFALALLGLSVASAQAIQIISATDGAGGGGKDVRAPVQRVVDRNEFSFPVTNELFGVGRSAATINRVTVVDEARGRRHTQSAMQNTNFRLAHQANNTQGGLAA